MSSPGIFDCLHTLFLTIPPNVFRVLNYFLFTQYVSVPPMQKHWKILLQSITQILFPFILNQKVDFHLVDIWVQLNFHPTFHTQLPKGKKRTSQKLLQTHWKQNWGRKKAKKYFLSTSTMQFSFPLVLFRSFSFNVRFAFMPYASS